VTPRARARNCRPNQTNRESRKCMGARASNLKTFSNLRDVKRGGRGGGKKVVPEAYGVKKREEHRTNNRSTSSR